MKRSSQVRRHLSHHFAPKHTAVPHDSLPLCPPILQLRGWPIVLDDHNLLLSLFTHTPYCAGATCDIFHISVHTSY
jgi:hypothetical protein|eukprot:COSAG06_NODE_2879_length_6140_cov_22.302930_5_plen_76_part_00